MRHIAWLMIAGIAGVIFSTKPAAAQTTIPSIGGMGSMQTQRPQRRLHKNRNPALSPALNMVPGVAGSFGGQFLMRTVPQEQALRNNAQSTRNFERLEGQVRVQQAEIRTGVGQSGHAVGFMNYGRYYHMGGGAGGGGGRH